jgi:small-conductance mechanosensitive channel
MSNSSAAAVPRQPIFPESNLHDQLQTLIAQTQAWVSTHWLQVLIAGGAGVLIFLALHALRAMGNRLCKRDTTGTGWWSVLGRAITKTGNFFIVMTAIKLVDGYADAPGAVRTTVNFLFTVASVFQAAVWAREIILGAIEHRTRSDNYHGEALGNAIGLIRLFVTFALFAIALVVVLSNLGVNVSGLIAGLGVGGIGIALAAQGIFADLLAALAIVFDQPFRRGDAITYDKSSGTVEAIGLKSTRIRGTNGEERIISNKNLLDKEILNNTRRDYRRVIFTLGLVQTTPVAVMEKIPAMLKEIIEANGAKYVRAGFTTFGTQSYDFDVEFDSPSAIFQDMFDHRHSIGLAIVRRFNEDGIALAYPTQIGLSAAEAGMAIPDPSANKPEKPVPAPPSSGDRSTADQEGEP